jgi:Predicted oxidoreductases (related to aryl-alcohol dehydrogenases)
LKYRNLGKWGLKVSEIALGSWMTDVGTAQAVETAKNSVRRAYELGVNFFDCADAYSGGQAEVFLGNILRQFPRCTYTVSSKVYFPSGSTANEFGNSKKHIIHQADKSLKNLQVDYLDMYFCHRFDKTVPLEETLQAMSDLVVQGKVLYYGVSEWSPVQITEAVHLAGEMGLRPLSVIQPQYNMMDRYIEDEIVGICEKYGIGIVPFSPLSQGLLSGKYRLGQAIPAGSRATHQADRQINNLLTDENLSKVEKLIKIAGDLGTDLSVLALAWLLRLPQISSLITGASGPEQIEKNIAGSKLAIPQDALAEIEKILDYKPFYRKIG